MENTQYNNDTEARGTSHTARMWTIFIIGIVIGFGGYYLWDNRSANDNCDTGLSQDTEKTENEIEENNDEGEHETGTSTKPSINDILAVSATALEQPEGLHVFVNSVSADRTVWIAVQEDNNGELGNILGAARLQEGNHEGVWVDLLRNTEASNTYYITAYDDNGDEVFSSEGDTLLPGPEGNGVIASFSAVRI